jgi:hypothetical protein
VLIHGGREEGGSDKAGPRHREREGDTRGQRFGAGEPGPQNREREREGERAGEVNWRRQVGSTGQRESEGEWALGVAPTGGARLSGREGARARTHTGWA